MNTLLKIFIINIISFVCVFAQRTSPQIAAKPGVIIKDPKGNQGTGATQRLNTIAIQKQVRKMQNLLKKVVQIIKLLPRIRQIRQVQMLKMCKHRHNYKEHEPMMIPLLL
jgi:hypothetical protein